MRCVPLIALLYLHVTSCAPRISAECKNLQDKTQKEVVEMISLLNQMTANPLLALNQSKVERVQYFNGNTAAQLNSMTYVCGSDAEKTWVAANLPILQEAQASLQRFDGMRSAVLEAARNASVPK